MLKLLHRLQHSTDTWFVIAIGFIFFLLRLPSFFEPYWYGDEGIYEVIGFALRHGRLLYRDIWDNKPPMLYLIYALFNGNQTPVRIFSCIVGLTALVLFFLLTKKLFTRTVSRFTATILFSLLLGLPFLEGNIANAENFMILPAVAAALCIVAFAPKKTLTSKSFWLPMGAGFLLGISFLIKVVAVFDFGAFLLFLIFIGFISLKKSWVKIGAVGCIFSIGFIIPIFFTFLFFATTGSLKIFIQSAFLNNVGYVNYGNQLFIPQGFLILKLLLLGGWIVFLFLQRKNLSFAQLFIYLWISFSIFDAFFSQRPYTHYLLVLIPSLCLFTGLMMEKIGKKTLFLSVIGVLALCFLLLKNFWFYSKTLPYYSNFISFATDNETVTSYQSFFDKVTPRDYAISDFIHLHATVSDTIFIWGDSGQIYRLAGKLPPGRYIVAYHIVANTQTIQETGLALQKTKPTFIIILSNAESFPYTMTNYRERILLDNAAIYEKIF